MRRVLVTLLALCLLATAATAVLGAGDAFGGGTVDAAGDATSPEAGPPEAVPPSFIGDADGNRISDDLDRLLAAEAPAEPAGTVGTTATTAVGKTYPVVVLLSEPADENRLAKLKAVAGSFGTKAVWTQALDGFSADLTAVQIAALAKDSLVERVDYDRPVQALIDTATTWTGVTRARTDFGVDGSRDASPTTYSKTDVVICILDTGIDTGHMDLDGGKVIAWKDYINGRTTPYDDNGHGTHCAGIAAGTGDANPAFRGVAPGAALVAVKVLDNTGYGSSTSIINGINWMISNRATYGIRIGSLSFGAAGSSDGSDSISQAVNRAVANGITMCVAAGNEGPDFYTIGTPGAATSAITVGAAVDPGYHGWALAYYSSRGPTLDGRTKPDICAPGHTITSAAAGTLNGYVTYSGTSMAAPFCAGVVALMLDANYALTDAQVKSIVFDPANVRDFGPSGKDNDFGYGLMLPYRDVRQAGGFVPEWSDGLAAAFYTGFLAGPDTYAFYTITVTNPALPVAANLFMPYPGCNFSLALDNAKGTRVASSGGVNRQATLLYHPTAAGTYTLVVRSSTGSGDYALSISQEDQSGLFRYSSPEYGVSEGVGNATFTVERTAGSLGTCSVDYSTASGTAAAGTDFGLVSGTLTFGPGVTRQTFQVPIVDDLLLEPAETFYLYLANATNGASIGSPATATVTITDNDSLGPPVSPVASTSPDGILLRWQPPSGPVPGGYEIHIATTSTGTYSKVKDVTNWAGEQPNTEVTAADFVGTGFVFARGQTYYLKLRSFFDLAPGNRVLSGFSAPASGVAGPLPPLAATGLAAATSADGARLNWQAPATGLTPQGYDIYIATTSTGPFTTLAKTVTSWDGASPNCEVTALDLTGGSFAFTAGRTYYFQVKGFYVHSLAGRLVSPASNTASAVAGPVPPLAARSLTAATTADGVRLNWLPPLTGVIPQGYDVYVATASTGPFTTLAKTVTSWDGASPNCEVTALDFTGGSFTFTGGRSYYFQVKGFYVHPIAGRLVSPASNTASAVAGPVPPLAATGLAASSSPDGVRLTWVPPATGVTPQGYEVYIAATSTGPFTTLAKTVTSWDGASPSCEVTALDFTGGSFTFTGGRSYYLQVKGFYVHPIAGRLVSPASNTASAVAGPVPPLAARSLTATTTADGVRLNWLAPLTGVIPQGYDVFVATTSTGPFTTLAKTVTSWDGASPNCEVTALDFTGGSFTFTGGRTYYFQVKGFYVHPIAGKMVSPASSTASTVAGPTPPLAPISLTAATSATGIHLAWAASTSGVLPQGYDVLVAASSTGPWTPVKAVTTWSGTAPNCEVTVLDFAGGGPAFTFTAGRAYYFRVYSYIVHPIAGKLTSASAASASATAGPAAPGAPTYPTAATTATGPATGIHLAWKPPTNAATIPPAGYSVWISASSAGAYTFVKDVATWTGTDPNCDVTVLDFNGPGEPVFAFNGGTRYYFRVYSYLLHPLDGSRVASTTPASAYTTAGPTPPGVPTYPTATTTATGPATGIHLGWKPPTSAATIPPAGYSVWISASSTGAYTYVKDVTSWTGADPNCDITVLDFNGPGEPVFAFNVGTRYYFRVYAYIAHPLDSSRVASATPASAYATAGPTAPGAPTYPTATTTATGPATGIHLGWKPPTNAATIPTAGYSVWISASSTGAYTFVKDVTTWEGANPNCDITVLDFNGPGQPAFTFKGGVTYYFRVYSFINHPLDASRVSSTSAASTSTVAGPTPPGVPTSATAATAPLGVVLNWRAPTNAATAPPAGYSVWISTSSTGAYAFVKDVTTWDGTYPNATVTAEDLDGDDLGGGVTEPTFALSGGARYYFRIYAYVVHALDGSHVASTTVASVYATAGPLPPNAPTSPVGATAADGFTLRWTPPTTGTAPTGYRIELSRSSTSGFVFLPDLAWSGPGPSIAVTGADIAAAGLVYTPGATYYARIHSFAPHPVSGEPLVSVAYASASAVAGPNPPNQPSYPTASTNPAASGGGVKLSWRPPSLGATPAGYQVWASRSSSSGFVLVKDVTSWTGTYPNCLVVAADFTAAGLTMTPGTRYYFRIYSYTLHPASGAPVLSLRYGSAYAVAG